MRLVKSAHKLWARIFDYSRRLVAHAGQQMNVTAVCLSVVQMKHVQYILLIVSDNDFYTFSCFMHSKTRVQYATNLGPLHPIVQLWLILLLFSKTQLFINCISSFLLIKCCFFLDLFRCANRNCWMEHAVRIQSMLDDTLKISSALAIPVNDYSKKCTFHSRVVIQASHATQCFIVP